MISQTIQNSGPEVNLKKESGGRFRLEKQMLDKIKRRIKRALQGNPLSSISFSEIEYYFMLLFKFVLSTFFWIIGESSCMSLWKEEVLFVLPKLGFFRF